MPPGVDVSGGYGLPCPPGESNLTSAVLTKALRSHIHLCIPVLMLLAALPTQAQEQTFAFNFSLPGHEISGVMVGTDLGNGSYFISDLSGTMDGSALTLLPQTPSGQVFPPLPTLFGSGNWIYDDIVYVDPALPLFDVAGLGLQNGATTFTLYGNFFPGSTPGDLYTYYYDDQLLASASALPPLIANVSQLTPVPESSTVSMTLAGFLTILACYRRRSARQ
jgi:hypothetical protein